MLTLRNPLDKDPTETKGTRTASLMGAPDPQPVIKAVNNVRKAVAPPAPVAPPQPTTYRVETVKAGTKKETEVGK